jgi:hypothetical protein
MSDAATVAAYLVTTTSARYINIRDATDADFPCIRRIVFTSEENDDSHHFVSAEHLCLSQDNSRLAGFVHDYADTNKIIWSRIVVYDTNTGSLLLSVAFRCCHSLCFNSDGNQVIVKEDDRLGVIDIRSGGETRLAVVSYSGYSRHDGLPIFLVPSNNAVVSGHEFDILE